MYVTPLKLREVFAMHFRHSDGHEKVVIFFASNSVIITPAMKLYQNLEWLNPPP